MKNYEVEAAWNYHNGTKHPNGPLLNRSHTYHPSDRPVPYKKYRNGIQIKLAHDKNPCMVTTLDAIGNSQDNNKEFIPDINLLSKILFFSGGITKTITFPTLGKVDFRAASCTGALYHIELYAICSDIPGLGAGVYHFDPKTNSLTRLRKGTYHRALVDAVSDEPFLSRSPVTLAFTDIFSRNSIKYQAREYRHAFWDSGTILSNSLAISTAYQMPHRLILGFIDSKVNEILNLDEKKEATLALLSIGQSKQEITSLPSFDKVPEEEPMEYEEVPYAISEMHKSSSLVNRQEVFEWRGFLGRTETSCLNQIKLAENLQTGDGIEETIIRRGSTRAFSHDSISFEQLSTILQRSTRGINSDFENNTMNDIYLIINAVDGLKQGAYFYNREGNSLEILQAANLREIAGHLGLDQNLPRDASASIFFMIDLQRILEKFGNRGYRVAQIDAGITAGRMYLASYALNIGATGLTFYDDEVTKFFSPHASNKSVMFMLAVGKKLKNTL